MQKGKGGMGSHKHGVSGTVGQNRRSLQSFARELNRSVEQKKKPKPEMFGSVKELMGGKKKGT